MSAPFYEYGLFGHGTSLLVALGIGVAFGWFLEQGGMGNARKLAAQFYLRDLTVFKLLFTAIITAMLGLFWLSRLGLVDLELVYVPPTYLLPQLAGGLVFGVGFVMGGLCPGTSCVAASSGRWDGLALMGGMIAGVVAFGEAFPLLEGFYNATPRGTLTFPGLTGLPYGLVTFLVVMAALACFRAAERIEARNGGRIVGPAPETGGRTPPAAGRATDLQPAEAGRSRAVS